jgi:ribosomal protein L2
LNAWSYKTGKSSETRKTETPNVEEVLQENIPERKLWFPKDKKKSRDLGIQVARHRRQQYTQNVAERTQSD